MNTKFSYLQRNFMIPFLGHHFSIQHIFVNDHNSPSYDESQTQTAKVLALVLERTRHNNCNYTPQSVCEFCLVPFSVN